MGPIYKLINYLYIEISQCGYPCIFDFANQGPTFPHSCFFSFFLKNNFPMPVKVKHFPSIFQKPAPNQSKENLYGQKFLNSKLNHFFLLMIKKNSLEVILKYLSMMVNFFLFEWVVENIL